MRIETVTTEPKMRSPFFHHRFAYSLGLLTLLLFGCATAPLTTGITGRALDRGTSEVDAQFTGYLRDTGNYTVTPSVRVIHGIFPRWDVGLHTEFQTFGLWARYSLLYPADGFGLAWALWGGVAVVASQPSYYVGTILSYRSESLEPYVVLRFNAATFDRGALGLSFFKTAPDFNFTFLSYALGMKWWWAKKSAFGTELTLFASPNRGEFATASLVSAQMSFLF